MDLAVNKSDSLGIISSTLCLIHCIATPFLFATNAQIANLGSWWSNVDLMFLIISALAIYKSGTRVTKKWISTGLWSSWGVLLFIIVNEKMGLFNIPETAIYLPSVSLIVLHFYSRRYCQCKTTECCTTNLLRR